MRKTYVVTITGILLFYVFNATYIQANPEEPGVFQIIACGKGASGFQVEEHSGIITALHSVVNCDTIVAITEDRENYFDRLSIDEVDIARDVVLLSSEKVKGVSLKKFTLPPPQVPISYEGLHVIGYPFGIIKPLTSRELRIRDESPQKLDDLIIRSQNLWDALRFRNSPSLEIEVLSIEGHLLPGHSGAPILNKHVQVVGVANGGLKDGYVEICWAIPWRDIKLQKFSSAQAGFLKGLPNPDLFHTGDSISISEDLLKLDIVFNGDVSIPQEIYAKRTAHYILFASQTFEPRDIQEVQIRKNDQLLARGEFNTSLRSPDGKYKFKVNKDKDLFILEVTYKKIPWVWIGAGGGAVVVAACLAAGCIGGGNNDGDSDVLVPFAIVEPQSYSTVAHRYVEVKGVGMKDKVSEFRCLVYTDKGYNQTYGYERRDDGSWETAANLGGQGEYNNHTIRVEVFYSDGTSDSAEVNGIIVQE